jgi:hypothetical protein
MIHQSQETLFPQKYMEVKVILVEAENFMLMQQVISLKGLEMFFSKQPCNLS